MLVAVRISPPASGCCSLWSQNRSGWGFAPTRLSAPVGYWNEQALGEGKRAPQREKTKHKREMRPFGSQSNTHGMFAGPTGFEAALREFRDLVSPLCTWQRTRTAGALAFGAFSAMAALRAPLLSS